jgi:hypothetical protein
VEAAEPRNAPYRVPAARRLRAHPSRRGTRSGDCERWTNRKSEEKLVDLVGKGHRIQVEKAFVRLIYSRNMTRRHEKAVLASPLYAEMARLCGLEKTQRLLDEAPRSWRNRTPCTETSSGSLRIISPPTGGATS